MNIPDGSKVITHFEEHVQPDGSVDVTVYETPEGKGIVHVQYIGNVPDAVKRIVEDGARRYGAESVVTSLRRERN